MFENIAKVMGQKATETANTAAGLATSFSEVKRTMSDAYTKISGDRMDEVNNMMKTNAKAHEGMQF